MKLRNKTPKPKDESGGGKPFFNKSKGFKPKRILISCLVLVFVIVIAFGGFLALKSYLSLKKVVKSKSEISAEGLKGDLDLSNLKGEGEGRVNILMLGVGDQGHAGEGLSDTMIFASIDPKTNEVVMVSLPRDLYVKIPGYWWSKINAAHAFAEQDKAGTGPEVAKSVVSEVTGQPIHYFLRVDFTGLKQAVDALSGIDIYNQNDLYDPDYPCEKNEGWSCGFKLKSGFYHMDGAMALKYARCRKGNCGDDFGRAARQQEVTVAMRDQALKLGNILNPTKIFGLIDIVGNHLKTDLSTDEIRRLIEISKKVNSNNIKNKVIDGENEGLVKTGNIGGASVVFPVAGVGKYQGIKAFVSSYLLDGYIKSENASVEIKSAGAKPGEVMALATRLESLGYNVTKYSLAPVESQSTKIVAPQVDKYPYTVKYLQNRLKVGSVDENKQKDKTSDIIIILGNDYEFKDGN